MSQTKKTTVADSIATLCKHLDKFAFDLDGQNEGEAAGDLRKYRDELHANPQDPAALKQTLENIIDAFEGDHELIAYTLGKEPEPGSWSAAGELFVSSSNVLSVTNRLLRTLQ